MLEKEKNIRFIRLLAIIIIVTTVVAFTPVMPIVGGNSPNVYASSYDGSQGLFQQIQMVDDFNYDDTIPVSNNVETMQGGALGLPYKNSISIQYSKSTPVSFNFALLFGMEGMTEKSFLDSYSDKIKLYKANHSSEPDTYEKVGGPIASLDINDGTDDIHLDKITSVNGVVKGFTLFINPLTLRAGGDYVLVFDKSLSDNNNFSTLGTDVEFYFNFDRTDFDSSAIMADINLTPKSLRHTTISVGEEFDVIASAIVLSGSGNAIKEVQDNGGVISATDNSTTGSTTVKGKKPGEASVIYKAPSPYHTKAVAHVTVKPVGIYDLQTNAPFTLSSDPSREIYFDYEKINKIQNTFLGDPFNANEPIDFTINWDASVELVGANAESNLLPNVGIYEKANNANGISASPVASYANGKLKYRAAKSTDEKPVFGVDANTLEEGKDYVLVIDKAAGTNGVRKTQKDVHFSFTTFINLENATISAIPPQTYNGKAITPAFSVTAKGKTPVVNRDYTVSYRSNINTGKGYLKITGTNKANGGITYSGSKEVSFDIKPFNINNAAASKITGQIYNGRAKSPNFTLKIGTKVLKKGVDYTVTNSSRKTIGETSLKINAKGPNFIGSKTLKFQITPKTNSLKSISVGKKKMTVKWNKVPKKQKVSKYQIHYKLAGTSSWKTKTVSSKASSTSIKNLKKGKKYQVQVRSYKTVSGKKIYSTWSKIKKSKKIK